MLPLNYTTSGSIVFKLVAYIERICSRFVLYESCTYIGKFEYKMNFYINNTVMKKLNLQVFLLQKLQYSFQHLLL